MTDVQIATMTDVLQAETIIRSKISPSPLIRSYALEKELGLPASRRVWLKDYGWTPVGSFKLLGSLNWVANNLAAIGERPIAAHSSGNFASGISFAGMVYGKRVIIVMPETAPRIKFEITRSFGAEIRTYDIATDHLTGLRDRMTEEIAQDENALQASPYDDAHVIAGNGVGGLEIAQALSADQRSLSNFYCPVSGGGLMAGHAMVIAHHYPKAAVVGVEPVGADDFRQSLEQNRRVRVEKPSSICDGLLSYDVGEHNWPILRRDVTEAVTVSDLETRQAMKWLYDHHGLRSEPSGAIALASLLTAAAAPSGEADVVVVVSGRNVDDESFRDWIQLD